MPASGLRKLPVLLVDDNDSLRRALARAIRLAGHDVESFPSVEAMLAERSPAESACLVLDIDLPGLRGTELKRRLVEAHCDIPTIFITALEADAVEDSLAPLDPVAVLYKPFDKDVLLEAIGRVRDGDLR